MVFGKKVKCTIVKPYGETFKIVHIKKIKIKNVSFSWNDGEYTIDLTYCIFSKKDKPLLFYEQGNALPITLKTPKTPFSSKTFKEIVQSNYIKKLLTTGKSDINNFLIIGMGACVVAIAIYAIWQISSLQSALTEALANLKVIGG
jgi:hypothetical protein